MRKPVLYMHNTCIPPTVRILRKGEKKKRLRQVFIQERKEPEHLVRSSSGVAIQGGSVTGDLFQFLVLFLALKNPETKCDGPTVL